MGEQKFISPEFSLAIQNYLATKEQDFSASLSFPVVVIRTLIFIYGELDIINPYITKNESNLGGFDSNLTKYGFNNQKLQDFKKQFNYYVRTINQPISSNLVFVKIEQYLIDMFFLKKKAMNLANDEVEKFKQYICLANNEILRDYYLLYMKDSYYLDYYFLSKYYDSIHDYKLVAVKREVLSSEAYIILGYSPAQIANMNDDELAAINKQVFQFFRISETESNRNNLLIQAVNYYKKYGNRVTSGNGYVDLLLLLSLISTVIFVILLIAMKVF